ncbi:hypothetical protein AB6A40_006532 [Gnathostoma spinigerum]|uniref:Tyrosine-protein phosphatase domain-containing protein n=1 Tax=Gnathostoma spinigerum TaxID=75299 RepID=A0ABD6EIM4_9BILA
MLDQYNHNLQSPQHLGLDKIEHKIVKGTGIQKVESNRVYLRVPEKLNEDQLKHLIEYIDHYIAKPNKIIIDEFMWDNGQLSFRVSRPEIIRLRHDKRIESAEGIAEAVYKRRKDIETMSGVRVDETGIGSGKGVIPVESAERDWLFAPILLICSLTIAALLSVLAVHFTRQYRRNRRSLLHPDLAERVDGKASVVYEELCRQRMSGAQEQPPTNGTTSKHSSTSSWGEEPVAQPTLDISTGHVLLTYLKQYLQNSSKIEEEWASLVNYTNPKGTTEIAGREENKQKNRNPLVLPYDETLVTLKTIDIDATKSNYINASSIYDSDPRQPLYIATQSPLPNTTADFWQMIWEQLSFHCSNQFSMSSSPYFTSFCSTLTRASSHSSPCLIGRLSHQKSITALRYHK